MIFALLLLILFSSDSWQHAYWRPKPYSWSPQFPSSGHLRPADDDVTCLALSDWADIYTGCNNDAVEILKLMAVNKQNEKLVDYSMEGRSKNNGRKGSPSPASMTDRSFGFKFLGFNALANYLVNSVSYTSTSTSYSTSYTTLTIGSVATCYTSTIFGQTTACNRKKREFVSSSAEIIVGDEDNTQESIDPSLVQGIEPSFSGVDFIVQREGKSFFDNIHQRILESSMSDGTHQNNDRHGRRENLIFPRKFGHEFLENLPGETLIVSASTLTSFVFYTTTGTKTVTSFAVANRLNCVPDCFTLC